MPLLVLRSAADYQGMALRVLGVLRRQPIALIALFVALGGSSYAAVNAGKPGQGDVL